MIKVLLFDIDGVTSTYKRLTYLNYLSKLTGKPRKELIKIGSPLIQRFDAGELTLQQFEKEAARLLGVRGEEVRWRDFYAPDTALDKRVVALIRELHKKYRTACLTNMDRSRYLYTKRFLDKVPFDQRFISSYLGAAKPNLKIYRKVLGKLKVKPSEVIFVDDNETNIIAAKGLGIKAVLFRGGDRLKKDLLKSLS